MTVGSLKNNMSASELKGWLAYYEFKNTQSEGVK